MFDVSVLAPEFRLSTSAEITIGRYEVSATVNDVTVTTCMPDLDLARMVLAEGLERPFADDSDAHGGIYDRPMFRTVHSWRGGHRAPRTNPIIDMFERERNDLLRRLKEGGGENRALHREPSQREMAIGSAPPSSQDDVVAKLVYIAQVVAEGSTPDDELVAGTIAEARRYLHGIARWSL